MVRVNTTARPGTDRKLRRDLRVLAKFVEVHCRDRHERASVAPARLKTLDLDALGSGSSDLCPACSKLLAHAFAKRVRCPLDPKPACKHCSAHCYQPQYREDIRNIMRYSGRRLALAGRLDYVWRLLF